MIGNDQRTLEELNEEITRIEKLQRRNRNIASVSADISELIKRLGGADNVSNILLRSQQLNQFSDEASINGHIANSQVPLLPFEPFTLDTIREELLNMEDEKMYTHTQLWLIPLSQASLMSKSNKFEFKCANYHVKVEAPEMSLDMKTTLSLTLNQRVASIGIDASDSYYMIGLYESPRSITKTTDVPIKRETNFIATTPYRVNTVINYGVRALLFKSTMHTESVSYQDPRVTIPIVLSADYTRDTESMITSSDIIDTSFQDVELNILRPENHLLINDVNHLDVISTYVSTRFLYESYFYQSGMFRSLSSSIIQEAKESAEYPIEQAILTVSDISASISELSESVARFMPIDITLDLTEPIGTLLDSQVLQHERLPNWMDAFQTPRPWTPVCAFGPNIPSRMNISLAESKQTPQLYPRATIVKDFGDYVVAVDLLTVGQVGSVTPFNLDIPQLANVSDIMDFYIPTNYDQSNRSFWFNQIVIPDDEKYSVMAPNYFSGCGCRISGVFLLFKEAYNFTVGDVGSASLEFQLADRRGVMSTSEFSHVSVNTDEYGLLYGIYYHGDVSMDVTFQFPKNQCIIRGIQPFTSRLVSTTSDGQTNPTFNGSALLETGFGQMYTTIGYRLIGDQYINLDVILSPSMYSKIHTDASFTQFSLFDGSHERVEVLKNSGHSAENVSAYYFGLFMQGSIRFVGRIPIAPGPLGYREIFDRSQNSIYYMVEELYHDVTIIKSKVNALEVSLAEVRAQVDSMIAAANPPLWKSLLQETLNIAMGFVLPVISGLGMKILNSVLSAATEPARRIARNIAATSTSMMHVLRSRNLQYNSRGISESVLMVDTVETVLEKSLANVRRRQRPLVERDEDRRLKLERIDPAENVDFQVYTRTGGIRLTEKPPPYNGVTSFNRNSQDLLTPTIEIRTRPLETLGPIRKLADKVYGNTKGLRRAMAHGEGLNQTRRLCHAYGITTRHYQFNDELRLRKTHFGVAEPAMRTAPGISSSRDSGGIGGLIVDYRQVGYDLRGNYVYAPLSHTEMGFTDDQVNSFYQSVIRGGKETNPAKQWNSIVSILDVKVPNSRKLAEYHVNDPSRLDAVEKMIMNPAVFNYNLFNNNCQSFVNGIVRYIQTGQQSNGFNDVANILHNDRVRYITGAIQDISSLIPSIFSLTYRRKNPFIRFKNV